MAEVRCALIAADVERLESGWMTASRRELLKEAGAVSAPLATSMAYTADGDGVLVDLLYP